MKNQSPSNARQIPTVDLNQMRVMARFQQGEAFVYHTLVRTCAEVLKIDYGKAATFADALAANIAFFTALKGRGQYDPFSRDWLRNRSGLDGLSFNVEWNRAISFGHIERIETATFNGAPAYRKGKNWN